VGDLLKAEGFQFALPSLLDTKVNALSFATLSADDMVVMGMPLGIVFVADKAILKINPRKNISLFKGLCGSVYCGQICAKLPEFLIQIIDAQGIVSRSDVSEDCLSGFG
jgi:hypothetical protein